MARTFNGTAVTGTGEYLEVDATPITAAPLTVAAWVYPADTTNFKEVVNISDKDDPNQWLVRLALTNTGVVRAYARDSATNDGGADTSSSYSANVWQLVSANYLTTGREVFLNGAGKGTNAVAKTPTGVDRISVGRAGDSTPSDPMQGGIGEIAIWNVALSDAEHAALGRGVHFRRMRRSNLILYYPLWGNASPETPVVGASTYNLSITGTPDKLGHHAPVAFFGFGGGFRGTVPEVGGGGSSPSASVSPSASTSPSSSASPSASPSSSASASVSPSASLSPSASASPSSSTSSSASASPSAGDYELLPLSLIVGQSIKRASSY